MRKLLGLLFLLFGTDLFAQVQAMTEDKEGTIWVASEDRLFKIASDGKVEPASNILRNQRIRALTPDKNGILWIGTDQGLFRCSGAKCEVDSRIPAAPVTGLAQKGESLWIATQEKIYQIRGNTVTSAALPSTKIEAIALDQQGVLWVGTRSSVQTFQNAKFQEMLKTSAQALAVDPKGSIWIGAGHELIRWQKGKQEIFALPPPPANVRMRPPITSILPSRSGKIYVGTHMGLLLWTGKHFKKLSDAEVVALFEDSKDSIWVGTSDGLKRMVNEKMTDVALPQ